MKIIFKSDKLIIKGVVFMLRKLNLIIRTIKREKNRRHFE
jgi:hypothetical protein